MFSSLLLFPEETHCCFSKWVSLLRGEILKTLLKSSLGCADAFSLIFHFSFVKKKFHLFSRLCRNTFLKSFMWKSLNKIVIIILLESLFVKYGPDVHTVRSAAKSILFYLDLFLLKFRQAEISTDFIPLAPAGPYTLILYYSLPRTSNPPPPSSPTLTPPPSLSRPPHGNPSQIIQHVQNSAAVKYVSP